MNDQTTEDARISDATKTDVADELDQTAPTAGTDDEQQTETGNNVTEFEQSEPKTFDEAYVKDLRDEAAKYRTKAKDRDALAQRLHAALVAADGRLQDPSDLNFDETHLDGTALQDAITDLLTRKPHLAARKVAGDVGQGSRNGTGTVDLLGMLRGQ